MFFSFSIFSDTSRCAYDNILSIISSIFSISSIAFNNLIADSLVTLPSYFLENDLDNFSIRLRSLSIFLELIEEYKSPKFHTGSVLLRTF